jgi:hypothetical protein
VHGGKRVVFLASDDDAAAAEIAALAENLGFSPIKLGGFSEGGLLVQARGNTWGRLIFKDLVEFDPVTYWCHLPWEPDADVMPISLVPRRPAQHSSLSA